MNRHVLLQYDKKWESDRGFVFYDYKQPEIFPNELRGTFDMVVVDPPFITEEVWALYATTTKLLMKDGVNIDGSPKGKMILTTLFENATMLKRILNARPTVSKILILQHFNESHYLSLLFPVQENVSMSKCCSIIWQICGESLITVFSSTFTGIPTQHSQSCVPIQPVHKL